MKSRRWELWTAAVTVLALAAMVLWAFPLRETFSPLGTLPSLPRPAPVQRTEELIDINTADLETLMKLPNIGEVRARAIIEYRENQGSFRYPEDLICVPGIGESTLDGLLDLITTGGGSYAENSGRG